MFSGGSWDVNFAEAVGGVKWSREGGILIKQYQQEWHYYVFLNTPVKLSASLAVF